MDFNKIKCVFCGYEMASKAKKPKCSQCGSRRFNPIAQFSVVKPYTMIKKTEGTNMSDETKEAKKPKQKEEEVEEEDDFERDLWG